MVFIEESSKRRDNLPKYISMAYHIMILWIPSKVTGNFLVNALHAFHRFNRRYHMKKKKRPGNFFSAINLAYEMKKITSSEKF